jgi:hypothetical protein|tara:strand:- start:385 stop:603 length:219 start_codon:yes stop_codon:yes gene_type:complete
MIESIIALLMYIGINLQEHVPYDNLGDCLKAKRISERSSGSDGPRLECRPVKAETEIWVEDNKKHIIRIIED